MSALSIQVPFPVFAGTDGQPLDNGYVWIGTANLNPQTNPVVAYYDSALTIPAVQPLRTLNGYISNAGTPAQVYVDAVSFSILVQDSKGSMVYNFSDGTGISPNAAGIVYDPLTGPETTVQDALRSLDATVALKGANTDITSLASPALGGATATTQTAGDNTTKVATTEFVTTAVGSDIISLPDPTLAANAMTLPASTLPITLAFRSTTATSGLATTVTGTLAALVIPSGATLGTVNAVQSTIVEVLINNAGTLERAVVNLAGGNDLSETGLISTTAIDTASDSANVFYSTTARTSVAYRVVRTITSTQATAGAYATTPSAVQGAGGNALTSMSSLGYGQTWQVVTGSRSTGTTYYNTTGKPIEVKFTCTISVSGSSLTMTVGGTQTDADTQVNVSDRYRVSSIVPPSASYLISASNTIANGLWTELR